MHSKTYIESTKWTGSDAHKLAIQASVVLQRAGYPIVLDKQQQSGVGHTAVMSDGIKYRIGIRELVKYPRRRFPIHEALAPTVACFHEVFGHGGQWMHEVQKDTPLSKTLFFNDMACTCSDEYYGADSQTGIVDWRYFQQPHEIAAQYMGLKMCRQFLSALYGSKKASDLLCEYVNLRIADEKTFVGLPDSFPIDIPNRGQMFYLKPKEPFFNIDDVLIQMQKNFINKVFEKPIYTISKDSSDYAALYINEQIKPWKRPFMMYMINTIPNRFTQSYLLTSFWLTQYDYDDWIRQLPVCKDVEFLTDVSLFSKRTVIGLPKEDSLDLKHLTQEDIDFIRILDELKQEGPQL